MKPITLGEYKKQIGDIIDNNATYEFDYTLKVNNGLTSLNNHISIGLGNIGQPDLKPINIIDDKVNKKLMRSDWPDDTNIPKQNYVLSLMTVFHELRHCNQQNCFKNPDETDAEMYVMALDTMLAKQSDACYNYSYLSMSHEIDAERSAIMDTFDYLVDNEIMTEDEAEKAIIDAVELKTGRGVGSDGKDFVSGYWVRSNNIGGGYGSLERIVNDFDKAFDDSCYNYGRVVCNTGVKQYDRLAKAFLNTDLHVYNDIANSLGVNKLEKLACVINKMTPKALDNYSIIKINLPLAQDLFGRDIKTKPSLIDRFRQNIANNVNNIDEKLSANSVTHDCEI